MYVIYHSHGFRRALRYRAETWHGVRGCFRSDPNQGQRSSRGQGAFEMPYDDQTW